MAFFGGGGGCSSQIVPVEIILRHVLISSHFTLDLSHTVKLLSLVGHYLSDVSHFSNIKSSICETVL